MRKLSNSLYLLLAGLAFSCGKKSLSPSHFEAWMQDQENGMIKEKTINQVKYKVSFQPVNWLLAKATKRQNQNLDIKALKQAYKDVMTFTLDITDATENVSMLRHNLRGENEYYQRVNYYSNLIQQDLYVVEGKDTLPCMYSHMEQTFNISPKNTITLEFVRTTTKKTFKDTWLVYNDRVFNTGIVKFHFDKKDLNSIPELKI